MALLAGIQGVHAQGAPGAGSFPGSFLVPGTQTSFKVGGYVKFDYTYDFGAQQDINGGADPIGIALDSGPATPADSAHHIHGTSQMTASESRFNIETRTPTAFGELKTFIEGDFTNPNGLSNSSSLHVNSNSYGFRLRQAYGTLGPFLAGQTASLFRDADAEAETLDFGGPMSNGVTRQPQVRYTFAGPYGISLALAAEQPGSEFASPVGTFNDLGSNDAPATAACPTGNLAAPNLDTTACITMFSKSRRNSWLDVCVIVTAISRSLRSTQKWVPKAPLHPKLPSDRNELRATGSLTTRTLRPNDSPRGRPGCPWWTDPSPRRCRSWSSTRSGPGPAAAGARAPPSRCFPDRSRSGRSWRGRSARFSRGRRKG